MIFILKPVIGVFIVSLDKNHLTPKEVAELLMVSTSAIRLWTEKGEIKALVTAGGHRRFKIEDIQQFARDTFVLSSLSRLLNLENRVERFTLKGNKNEECDQEYQNIEA